MYRESCNYLAFALDDSGKKYYIFVVKGFAFALTQQDVRNLHLKLLGYEESEFTFNHTYKDCITGKDLVFSWEDDVRKINEFKVLHGNFLQLVYIIQHEDFASLLSEEDYHKVYSDNNYSLLVQNFGESINLVIQGGNIKSWVDIQRGMELQRTLSSLISPETFNEKCINSIPPSVIKNAETPQDILAALKNSKKQIETLY